MRINGFYFAVILRAPDFLNFPLRKDVHRSREKTAQLLSIDVCRRQYLVFNSEVIWNYAFATGVLTCTSSVSSKKSEKFRQSTRHFRHSRQSPGWAMLPPSCVSKRKTVTGTPSQTRSTKRCSMRILRRAL